MVLYRKYRPQKLSDLVGHEEIKKTLLAQLSTGKISHGYLFYGPKGTGKTSTARIFSKAVNCEVYSSSQIVNRKNKKEINDKQSTINGFGEPCNKCLSCTSITDGSNLDLIEIDAASNRGIDEIRDLRQKIKLSPIASRFKVYIIDEAHMLTNEAFNALLKTLEEPPAHAIFILCTTEVSKLPATIVSRLTRFNFRRASQADLAAMLLKITKVEKISVDGQAIAAIAQAADGSYRDAVSLLDVVSTKSGKIGAEDVEKLAVGAGFNKIVKFVGFIAGGKLKEAVLEVDGLAAQGADIANFTRSVILFLEKLLFVKIGAESEPFDDFDDDELQQIRQLSQEFNSSKLANLMRLLILSENEIKLYPLPQIPLILALFQYLESETDKVVEVSKVSDVEITRELKVSEEPEESKRSEVPERAKEPEKTNGTRGTEKKSSGKISKNKKTTLAEIEKKWGEFLSLIKEVNIHVPALLRSTKTLDFDGENLTLEVFYRFHKDKLEEPKIIRVLDEKISEAVGADIKFRFVLAKKETKPPAAVAASNVVDIKEEELAQIAQEIFSK